MKIGPGVSELWMVEKSPSPIDLAHGITAGTTVRAVIAAHSDACDVQQSAVPTNFHTQKITKKTKLY